MLTYNYYGHACFQLDDGKDKILVDPFLTGNPQASISEKEVQATYILITHAHGDHIGDAPNIAVRTGATVVGIPEIVDFGGGGGSGSYSRGTLGSDSTTGSYKITKYGKTTEGYLAGEMDVTTDKKRTRTFVIMGNQLSYAGVTWER